MGKSDRQSSYVLVADDDPDTLEILQLFFEREGLLVRTATNGLRALELVEASDVGVVILDLRLPDIYGCDVAKEVRRRFITREKYLVALTASCDGNERRRASLAGFDTFVEKPIVHMDAFLQLIKTAVADHEAARQSVST